jgi:hypothetical protein
VSQGHALVSARLGNNELLSLSLSLGCGPGCRSLHSPEIVQCPGHLGFCQVDAGIIALRKRKLT